MTDARHDVVGAFAAGVAERLGFYVYLLRDPLRANEAFYVGKGQGDRCFAHECDVADTAHPDGVESCKRDRIRTILDAGARVEVELLRHGLKEEEALLLESATIDLLRATLVNEASGHHATDFGRCSVADINARYGARPIDPRWPDRLLLIRLNVLPPTEHELYERTRKWWRISKRWTDLASSESPTHAMAVYRGVGRAVFAIQRWELATTDDCLDEARRRGRFAFVGSVDSRLSDRYRFADVSALLSVSAQNPLYFHNCGPRARRGLVD